MVLNMVRYEEETCDHLNRSVTMLDDVVSDIAHPMVDIVWGHISVTQ